MADEEHQLQLALACTRVCFRMHALSDCARDADVPFDGQTSREMQCAIGAAGFISCKAAHWQRDHQRLWYCFCRFIKHIKRFLFVGQMLLDAGL